MKNTMNQRNVAEFHKLLKNDVPYEEISKYMQIEIKTLKRFTPSVFDKLKKQRQADKAVAVQDVTNEPVDNQKNSIAKPAA